jgi:hypothetical protein
MAIIYLRSILEFLWERTTGTDSWKIFLIKVVAFYIGTQAGNGSWRLRDGAASNLQDLTELQLLNFLLGIPNELIADIIGPVPFFGDGTISQWFENGDVPRQLTPAMRWFFFVAGILSLGRVTFLAARYTLPQLRILWNRTAVLAEFIATTPPVQPPPIEAGRVPVNANPNWFAMGAQPFSAFNVTTPSGAQVRVLCNATEAEIRALVASSPNGIANGCRFADNFYSWVGPYEGVIERLPGGNLGPPRFAFTLGQRGLIVTPYANVPIAPASTSVRPLPPPPPEIIPLSERPIIPFNRLNALYVQFNNLAGIAEQYAFIESLSSAENSALFRRLTDAQQTALGRFYRERLYADALARVKARLAAAEAEIIAAGGVPLGQPQPPVVRGIRSLPVSWGELGSDLLAGARHGPNLLIAYQIAIIWLNRRLSYYTFVEIQEELNAGVGFPLFRSRQGPSQLPAVPNSNTLGGYWVYPARWPGRVQQLWYLASQQYARTRLGNLSNPSPILGLQNHSFGGQVFDAIDFTGWIETSVEWQRGTVPIFLGLLQAESNATASNQPERVIRTYFGGPGPTPAEVQDRIDRGRAELPPQLPSPMIQVPHPPTPSPPQLPASFGLGRFPARFSPTVAPPLPLQPQLVLPTRAFAEVSSGQSSAGPLNLEELLATLPAGNYIIPPGFGVSHMPQLKGTAFYNTPEGGFSESLYLVGGTQTYANMFAAMNAAVNARCRLSVTRSNPNCPNPIVPVGIRVEDELAFKDGITNIMTPAQCPAGFTQPTAGSTPAIPYFVDANVDLDIAAKIQWFSGTPGQTVFTYLHGLPVFAFSNPTGPAAYLASGVAFDRFTAPNGSWLANFQSYLNVLRNGGNNPTWQGSLGFRNLSVLWTQANTGNFQNSGTPVYNAATQQLTIQWPAPPAVLPTTPNPNGRIRVVMRGWKGFQVLNGRWSATVMTGGFAPGMTWGLTINRLVRAFPTGLQPGNINVIGWTYWTPAANAAVSGSLQNGLTLPVGALFIMATDKKCGRPFFQDRGRARNRPQ